MNKFNYYKHELSKIKNLEQVNIKITDFDGNETRNFTLNKESIKELNKLIKKLKF